MVRALKARNNMPMLEWFLSLTLYFALSALSKFFLLPFLGRCPRLSYFAPLALRSKGLCRKSGHTRSSLCNLCVLCASVVHYCSEKTTTETQSTPRLHREEAEYRLFVQSQFSL